MLLLRIEIYHIDLILLKRYSVWDVKPTRATENCYWMSNRGSLQVQKPTHCTISLFALRKLRVYPGYGSQPNCSIRDTFSMYQVYRSTKHKTNPNTFLTMKIHPKGLLQEWKTLSLFLHRVPVGLVVQSLFGWTCTKFRPVSWATSTAFPFQELGASCPPRREQQFIAFQF